MYILFEEHQYESSVREDSEGHLCAAGCGQEGERAVWVISIIHKPERLCIYPAKGALEG